MSDASTQQHSTPARRRQGRRPPKAGSQRAYASENDAAAVDAAIHHRTPQTPDKMTAASPVPVNSHTQQQGSKQRSRTKPKQKNQVASPESGRATRHTPPPQRSASSKPASTAAFAGATFHASPAPSALPIPSFLSKPSSGSPAITETKGFAQEPSPPATDTEIPTPYRSASASRPHESPLDFMFRAHREEKERQHRGSFHTQRPAISDPTSPPSQSPFELSSSPKSANLLQAHYPQGKQQYAGIDSAELDGTPGRPMGPAFSTPYHERIKAARNTADRLSLDQTPPKQPNIPPADDPTEALKKFLFNRGTASSESAFTNTTNSPTTARSAQPPRVNPVPSGPAMATTSYDRAGNHNIQAMENDLRRILKLDLAPTHSSSEQEIYPR